MSLFFAQPAQSEPAQSEPAQENGSEPPVVVVTAPRPREARPASTAHVAGRELARLPQRTAEDALSLVPGLTLVQHGSEGKAYQFFLRGFDAVHGADFEVTVEGLPVNEWSNVHGQGYVDLGFVIPEVIHSVEVLKGPFSIDQGAFAMAGSAEYRLGLAPRQHSITTGYGAGTTGRHEAVFTFSPDPPTGRSFVAGRAVEDAGFGERRKLTHGSSLVRLPVFESSRRGSLAFFGGASVARFELPGAVANADVAAGRVGFYDSYDPAGHGLSGRTLASVHYRLERAGYELSALAYAGRRLLSLNENVTGYLVDPVNGDSRGQDQETTSFGAKLDLAARLSEELSLRAGFGAHGDTFDQRQARLDAEGRALSIERQLEGFQSLVHAKAALDATPSDTLSVALGTRLDLVHAKVQDGIDRSQAGSDPLLVASPRLVGTWHALRSLHVTLAYGRGFRPPEARAFAAPVESDTSFEEERAPPSEPRITVSDSVEAGLRYKPHRDLSLSLAGFGTFIERETVFDHVSGTTLELNSTRRLGGELELSANPLSAVWLSADLSLVDARFVRSGRTIPFAPSVSGGLRAFLIQETGFQAGLQLLLIAPRALPHGARGSSLTRLDAKLGYWFSRLHFDLEVENLLARRLAEGEYHYASQWQIGGDESRLPRLHTVAGPPLNARLLVTASF